MADQQQVLALIDVAQAKDYFKLLFGMFDIPDGAAPGFAVRGVGEKNTPAEGALRASEWVSDAVTADELAEKLVRWATHDGGAFVVPAFVRGDVYAPSNIHEKDVVAFTSILADLDKGDPMLALKHAATHLGSPSMVIESGGTTELNRKKLHAYWFFSESATNVQEIAVARELLAMKLGGDPSFGRVPQIIRIPGSVHLKGGIANPVRLVHQNANNTYDAAELVEKIHELPIAPGQEASFEQWKARKDGTAPLLAGGTLTFGPQSSAGGGMGNASAALTSDIHEGGDEERSRWSEFSKVAGHYIHCARAGEIAIEEALTYTGGWVAAHMKPAWPPDRVQNEFRAILNKDIRDKGAVAPPSENRNLIITAPDGQANPEPENPLLAWSPARWVRSTPPERKWLVRGLLPARKASALVAEGGAGKTYMSLDLALKLAGGGPELPMTWLGEPIPNDAYGAVVVITAEDDKDELAIRLSEIDDRGLRHKAGDRLIVLPLIDVGGTFPLATSRKIHKAGVTIDEHGPTEKWDQLVAVMKGLPDLKLVIIDTLNATMHGEENSATVVQEYFRQATRICGELGAAVMVTHHLKKQNPKDPIITIADAESAFRGSEAIKSSVRQVITFWHAHDWKQKMDGLGLKPEAKMLYRAAITKANNRDAFRGVKTLLRTPVGLLEDITAKAAAAQSARIEEARAWLLVAVQLAAAAGRPYAASKSSLNNPAKRSGELPPFLKRWSVRAFEQTLEELEGMGALVKTAKGFLDVPGGPLAAGIVNVETKMAYRAPEWAGYEFDDVSMMIHKRGGQ